MTETIDIEAIKRHLTLPNYNTPTNLLFTIPMGQGKFYQIKEHIRALGLGLVEFSGPHLTLEHMKGNPLTSPKFSPDIISKVNKVVTEEGAVLLIDDIDTIEPHILILLKNVLENREVNGNKLHDKVFIIGVMTVKEIFNNKQHLLDDEIFNNSSIIKDTISMK